MLVVRRSFTYVFFTRTQYRSWRTKINFSLIGRSFFIEVSKQEAIFVSIERYSCRNSRAGVGDAYSFSLCAPTAYPSRAQYAFVPLEGAFTADNSYLWPTALSTPLASYTFNWDVRVGANRARESLFRKGKRYRTEGRRFCSSPK